MLKKILGLEIFSILYGFLRYNHITMDPKDIFKATVTTPWVFFSYVRIPFVIINVGATFKET